MSVEVSVDINGFYARCTCPACGYLCEIDIRSGKEDACCHYRKLVASTKYTFTFWYILRTMFCCEYLQKVLLQFEGRKERQGFVRRLNSNIAKEVHSAEWELVIIDWLRQVGEVRYEFEQENGKKPDVSFNSLCGNVDFVADTASVSDETLEKLYPASDVIHEIQKILKKVSGGACSFDVSLKSATNSNLEMFAPARLNNLLLKFEMYIVENVKHYGVGGHFSYALENNLVEVKFLPKGEYLIGSYPAREYVKDQIRNNPVYTALDGKARNQLPKNSISLVGVILCDSGCRLLNSRPSLWNAVRLSDIVGLILEEHKHVDFVFVISVPEATGLDNGPQLEYHFYSATRSHETKYAKILKARDFLLKNAPTMAMPRQRAYQSRQRISGKLQRLCCWQFAENRAEYEKLNALA